MPSAAVPRGDAAERHWPAVWLIVGAGVVSAFQVGKAPMALSAVQSDLGLGIAIASLLISAFAIVGALAGTPIGLAVDRVGARRMIVAGLVLQAAGSGLGGLSQGVEILLAMRALEGLGFLAVIVAAPSLITSVAPLRKLDRAMALWATFMPVGMTLVMLASPLLSLLEWRGFWLLNAGVLIVYAALFAIVMGVPRSVGSDRNGWNDLRKATADRGPWGLAAIFAAFSAAFFSVFSFLPVLLSDRFAIATGLAGIMVGIAIAASAVGNIICGQLLARGVHSRSIVLLSFGVMAACAVGIFATDVRMALLYGLGIVLSFASGFIPVVVFHEAPNRTRDPELIGVTMGMAMQGNNLGLLIGPAVAGGLASTLGWPAVAVWTVSICLAAIWLARNLLKNDALIDANEQQKGN